MNPAGDSVQTKRNLCAAAGSKYRCAAGFSTAQAEGCEHAEMHGRRCRWAVTRQGYRECACDAARRTATRWGRI